MCEFLDQIHPLSNVGLDELQRYYSVTDRQTASLIPGIDMSFTISYHKAQQLKAAGVLVEEMRNLLQNAMSTRGKTLA